MAPDKNVGDNGHFTLNDIGELNRIDEYNLVVLSACETAVKNDLVEGYPQTTASAF
jgi:CHAT domain-containing protein